MVISCVCILYDGLGNGSLDIRGLNWDRDASYCVRLPAWQSVSQSVSPSVGRSLSHSVTRTDEARKKKEEGAAKPALRNRGRREVTYCAVQVGSTCLVWIGRSCSSYYVSQSLPVQLESWRQKLGQAGPKGHHSRELLPAPWGRGGGFPSRCLAKFGNSEPCTDHAVLLLSTMDTVPRYLPGSYVHPCTQ